MLEILKLISNNQIGIEIKSNNFMTNLSSNKLFKIMVIIKAVLLQKVLSLKEAQFFMSYLSFCNNIVDQNRFSYICLDFCI